MRETVLVIACLLSLVCPIKAIDLTSHYATVGAQVGAAKHRQMLGPEAGLSAGYAFRYNRFLLHAGLEAAYRYQKGTSPDYTDTVPGFDSENDPCIFYQDYSSIRRESRELRLAVPLRLGGQWGAFYILAGPAFALSVARVERMTADITTSAEYDFLIDRFTDMPNHGLATEPIDSGWGPEPVSFGVDAAAEAGWILSAIQPSRFRSDRIPHDWRLSLYADVGLWRNNPSWRSASTWSAGIRLSVWIQPPHYFPCRCLNN